MSEKLLVINPVLGADPEVFIYATGLNKVVSSLDMVGGTKDKPKPLPTKGFFVQEDNVLAEYNVPVSKTKKDFVFNIHHGLSLIKDSLPEGFVPLVKSSHRFDPEQLQDPRAFIMGCDPDFNAWTFGKNSPPDLDSDPYLRSSGGHIHIGYDDPNSDTNNLLVRMLDAMLAVPAVLLDLDTDRRKLYGKAGAHRDKNYGVEYRTLSSFWVSDPEITGWAFDQVHAAIDRVNSGHTNILEHEALIVNTINNADKKSARQFIKKYQIAMPS